MQQGPDDSVKSTQRRTVLVGLAAAGGAAVALTFWKSPGLSPVKPFKEPAPVPKLSTSPHNDLPETAQATSSAPGAAMTRERFLPHLNSKFQMHAENLSATPVELIEVSPTTKITDKDHHIDYTSFSLVFKGDLGMPKESQIYHLDHDKLGKMDVFLSPIGRYKDQVRYEAIFNQRA